MDRQEITKYIGQHSAWKARLREAIDKGSHSWNVPDVRRDDQCEFGKWLRSLPSSARSNEHCQNVENLHADFHREAARVLELVDTGKKDQADEAMDLKGSFTAASTKLTQEMMQWKQAV